MGEHDTSRRKFLVNAAVSAGAAAGAGMVPRALGQDQETHGRAAAGGAPSTTPMKGEGRGAFFNADDAATVAAFTERIMPGAPGLAGARDAGVLNYIDLALAGAYSDLQDLYRRGLAQLDAYCRRTHHHAFVGLPASQQDEVLAALDDGQATGFSWPTAQEFFNTVRTHTMEGMFADPLYGGNRNFAGWRLVGFPGAQAVFTPSDLRSQQEFTRESIIGLQAEAKTPVRRS
jgi:gluconate 2-dehydrogenase gamma chain